MPLGLDLRILRDSSKRECYEEHDQESAELLYRLKDLSQTWSKIWEGSDENYNWKELMLR